jgi:uncharacterized protein YggE
LGALLEINAQSQRIVPLMGAMETLSMARASSETPISSRDITVHANVAVRWRFVPGR